MARIAPYSEDQPPAPAPASTAKKTARMSMAPPTMEPEGSRSKSGCTWLRNCREACIESQTGQAVRKFLRGRPFSIVAMIALFLALFLGEIFVVCQVPSNTEQDVVLTIVFALFIFEWVGLTLTDANYLFGFFFVMDCVGTASMVLDITYMFGPDAMAVEEVTEGASQDNVIVVRAARAAKLGARAGRLSRAVKLLKMLPGMSTKEDASKVKPSGYPAAQLSSSYPSYTPNVAGGPTQPVPHAAPAPQRTPMVAAQAPSASGPVVWLQNSRPANTYAAEGQAFAESRIRSAADFLPHTPPNALLDWLKYLVSGQMEPGEPTPDGGKYWDKRRVQTSLRRLLESLQEWAETRRLPDKDGSFDDMTLAREVLQGILQALPGRRRTTVENMKMTEQDFINGVQMLGVWPPELTPNDRKEVFAALLVPSQRIVRLLKEGQMSLPRALNCQSLADGLASVPYVLPDFPVPLHLLKAILLKPAEIAKDIAARFCSDGGVDAIKDFYISGLISLEEVQISLPYLLQIRKLEEAVELILRSSRFFTPHEWQKYVYSIRGEDSQEQARVEDFEVHNTPSAPARCESPKAIQRIPEDERADDCAATLRHFLEDPGKRTVVNWNTAKAKRRSHQADEGAGVQLCGDRPTFLAGQAPEPGDEGIRLISLDWHNECLGPLLAGAFVRCCQIHQAKSSGDREKA